jgi:hypothetical protein
VTTRREAVRALAGIAAMPFFGNLGVTELTEIGRRVHDRAGLAGAAGDAPRALTVAEFEIVKAAAERIVPRTDTPGATDARVAEFIDVMLADWYDATETARFKAGIADLDARARTLSGSSFPQSSAQQQTELLTSLDNEFQVARNNGSANDQWFGMLKHLTVWGYYTSEVGIAQELRVKLIPGYYDGNAQYRA